MLILPGNPLFAETLACPPPNWQAVASQQNGKFALIARADSGILEAVSHSQMDEYEHGGEYAQRLLESGQIEEYLNAFGSDEDIEAFYVMEYDGDDNG